jgi:hypothetical protein
MRLVEGDHSVLRHISCASTHLNFPTNNRNWLQCRSLLNYTKIRERLSGEGLSDAAGKRVKITVAVLGNLEENTESNEIGIGNA